jgi:WD40 repeat protein
MERYAVSTIWLKPLQLAVVLFICAGALSYPVTIASAQVEITQPIAAINAGVSLNQIAWHPDGTVLAVGSSDGLRLYDESLQLVTQIHAGVQILSVSWNPTGSALVLTNDLALEIWNWDSSQQTFSLHMTALGTFPQVAAAWSPDGMWIASFERNHPLDVSGNDTIVFWNAQTLQVERTATTLYATNTNYPAYNMLKWHPQGQPFVMGLGNGLRPEGSGYLIDTDPIIYVIDVRTGERVNAVPLRSAFYLSSVAWHPDGDLVAVPNQPSVNVYRLSDPNFFANFGMLIETSVVAWSPDGRYLAGDCAVSDVANIEWLGTFVCTAGHLSIAWHPSGDRLAQVTKDGQLRIEDATLLPGFIHLPTRTPFAPASTPSPEATAEATAAP